MEQELHIPCAGSALPGTLTIPPAARGLVIFAHGSGSSRNSRRNRQVAREMHRHRLATLLFDLLTPREAGIDEQTAELRFNIPFLTNRLVAVTRWLQDEPVTNDLKFGYFGSSTGAAAALAAAARLPEIAAVVSRGGRSDLAGDAIDRVHAATLLIAGGEDEPVIHWNRESLRRLPGVKQLQLIPGASHLFMEPGALEQVAALAGAWFEKHLAPAASAD